MTVKLNTSKLLGYRLAKTGAKVGAKAGTKIGTKIGVKIAR